MEDTPKNNGPKGKSTQGQKTESKKGDSVLSDISSKIPDISELKNKFDLDKILDGIKAMVGAEDEIHSDPNDALEVKIEQLSALFKEITHEHTKLAKDYAKANEILAGLFKDLQAVRQKKQA